MSNPTELELTETMTTPRSDFKGVRFDRARQKWRAEIRVNGKRVTIGRFSTAEAAAAACAEKADELARVQPATPGRTSDTAMLAEAMRIVREADPETRMRLEMWEAVKGEDLLGQRATPPPSMAGQSPVNASLIAAKELAAAQAEVRDRADRARFEQQQTAAVPVLSAAQSPDNVRLVAATVRAGT